MKKKVIYRHPVGCVQVVKVEDGFFVELYGLRLSAFYGPHAYQKSIDESNAVAKRIRP